MNKLSDDESMSPKELDLEPSRPKVHLINVSSDE